MSFLLGICSAITLGSVTIDKIRKCGNSVDKDKEEKINKTKARYIQMVNKCPYERKNIYGTLYYYTVSYVSGNTERALSKIIYMLDKYDFDFDTYVQIENMVIKLNEHYKYFEKADRKASDVIKENNLIEKERTKKDKVFDELGIKVPR